MSEECSIDDGATDVIDAPRLYAEHWHAMVRLAFLLTDSKSAAEDLVQDAFIALHRAAARIAEPGAAMAYVRAAIVNRSRSEVRRAVVARKHLSAVARDESVPGADRPALADAENQRVLDALRTLPTRQREVLIMRYWSELSESEIAEALAISPGTVKSSASRGMATLKKALGGAS